MVTLHTLKSSDSVSDEPAIEEICDELIAYGNPPKDIKKVFDQIIEKFSQLKGGNGIVALWSDLDDLEELEFEFAMKDIRRDAIFGIREVPATLLLCVFGSGWFNPRRGQRIYTESFQQLSHPFLSWAEDLEDYRVDEAASRRIRNWDGSLPPSRILSSDNEYLSMKLIDPWIAKRNPERSQGSHAEPRLQRPWLWSAGHSAYDVASLLKLSSVVRCPTSRGLKPTTEYAE